MCLECKTEVGTLTKSLWSCHKLQKYWSDILEISSRFGNGSYMVLGLPSRCITTVEVRSLCNILTFASRKKYTVCSGLVLKTHSLLDSASLYLN